jgi:hypothetical protein
MATLNTSDFMILGPAMASGDKVLHAIHALYFLPENFKLILAGSEKADQSFLKRVKEFIDHVELGHRVALSDEIDDVDVIILPNTGMSRMPKSIAGNSPEALASAILNVARNN